MRRWTTRAAVGLVLLAAMSAAEAAGDPDSGREAAELTRRPFIRVELRRLFPSEIELATAGRLEGTVRDIQNRLAALGYYAGPRDGRITPATRHAARRWRREHGLAVHGALDQPLLRRLPPAPAELARGE